MIYSNIFLPSVDTLFWNLVTLLYRDLDLFCALNFKNLNQGSRQFVYLYGFFFFMCHTRFRELAIVLGCTLSYFYSFIKCLSTLLNKQSCLTCLKSKILNFFSKIKKKYIYSYKISIIISIIILNLQFFEHFTAMYFSICVCLFLSQSKVD